MRHEPPPPRGDHGTAYPFPKVLPDGSVLATTGQGKGRVVVVNVDPDWLCETHQQTEFSDGLDDWSTFGTRGVELTPHPDDAERQVLSIARIDIEWPAAAVWNFPMARKGSLGLRIRLSEGFGGGLVMLTDHFTTPFDPEDEMNALFCLAIRADGGTAVGGRLETGRWHDLRLGWDRDGRQCEVELDDVRIGSLPLLRQSEGPCYLRLKATGGAGSGIMEIDRVVMEGD